MSGRNSSAFLAASATVSGSLPKSWTAAGRSPSVRVSSSVDFRSFIVKPLALTISVVTMAAP